MDHCQRRNGLIAAYRRFRTLYPKVESHLKRISAFSSLQSKRPPSIRLHTRPETLPLHSCLFLQVASLAASLAPYRRELVFNV